MQPRGGGEGRGKAGGFVSFVMAAMVGVMDGEGSTIAVFVPAHGCGCPLCRKTPLGTGE